LHILETGGSLVFQSLLDLLRHTANVPLGAPAAMPDMGLTDEGSSLHFHAHLPGIDPRSVQVQLTESNLAIAGYGTREERTEGPDFYRLQSGVSSFYREVPLPLCIDPHGAAMHWQADGSLLITLPKQRAKQAGC
jgi:HSP20 family molecular chaperone IbpA